MKSIKQLLDIVAPRALEMREWGVNEEEVSYEGPLGDAWLIVHLADALQDLRKDLNRQRQAILNQCGDNLCWIEDTEKAKALPAAEFLESCRRYYLQISAERGVAEGLPTIAQLEAEIERLKNILQRLNDGLEL